ncbi:hypothetical protein ONE63_002265 [Megalurothrips usitatus]|uniref:Uncharacterized protein n=1 Tax=Megalurothrips usitatus TaxID=439358 RepID=A0AAV7XE96_9NEOP|nr:hypothetical protein ONE63_002265 [Megalurothrips usitatus]
MSRVPPAAPGWPLPPHSDRYVPSHAAAATPTFTRNNFGRGANVGDDLALVDIEECDGGPGRPGHDGAEHAGRRLRMPPPYAFRDVGVDAPHHRHHDGYLSSASDFDLAVRDRDDDALSAYSSVDGGVWDGAGTGTGLEGDDGGLGHPPASLGAVGDVALDADFPLKHDGDQVKAHVSSDGRGPVVVRGPPFNSVAIGFLVYLILLTVLQNSISNVTNNKGLLAGLLGGLGLGLRPAKDRGRRDHRDMERRVAAAASGYEDFEALVVQDQDEDRGGGEGEAEPVLVAAVLDAEPDQTTLGGPRRAGRRTHRRRVTTVTLPAA